MTIYPSPFDYFEFTEYLKDLVEVFKQRNISLRKICKELNWPASYIHELLSGRKNLTCLRALELAKYCSYNPQEVEKLILLGIQEGLPEKFSNYFSENIVIKKNKDYFRNETKVETQIDHIVCHAIFEIVRWAEGKLDKEQILNLTKQVEKDKSKSDASFESLVENKIIGKNEDGTYSLLIDNSQFLFPKGMSLEMGKGRTKEFVKSLLNFVDDPHGPCTHNDLFVSLPRARAVEVCKKVIALHNWIDEISIQEQDKRSYEGENETRVYQYSFNFFPIFKIKEAEEALGLNK